MVCARRSLMGQAEKVDTILEKELRPYEEILEEVTFPPFSYNNNSCFWTPKIRLLFGVYFVYNAGLVKNWVVEVSLNPATGQERTFSNEFEAYKWFKEVVAYYSTKLSINNSADEETNKNTEAC